ncbi:hypothetical protein EYF80_054351 [Liparis tanakae]|uniref:Uncharacterized protein n=1 Tax=Liparis tanakae TaxID=230148 RepID=A0A4Z2F3M3_9TELE|nr:hypothetical protein EYF80_054351 [Liparis tanakae]
MCVAEAPVLRQDLPLAAAQVLGGQAPQHGPEVLRLRLVVLLEAQRSAHPGVLLTAHLILKGSIQSVHKRSALMIMSTRMTWFPLAATSRHLFPC